MIAMSRTQGSCTRPGDVPQVWGISQWVGVWGAFGLARGNLLLPTWKLPTQSFCAGTWVPLPTLFLSGALPVLGQISAVALFSQRAASCKLHLPS